MKEFSNFHDGAIDNHGEFRGHPNMSSSNTDTERVCYKDKSQFSEEFFVYCEFGMTELYRKGKKTISETVQAYDVYICESGGEKGKTVLPSNQMLENAFGTSDKDEIIAHILTNGEIKPLYSNVKGGFSKFNQSREK